MGLKQAREYYRGPSNNFNPLWQHIGGAFQEVFLSKAGDSDFTDELYVEARTHSGGILESDLVGFAQRRAHRLLVLEGWAGIGKTTLLRRSFAGHMSTPGWRIIWLDVMSSVGQCEPDVLETRVLALIAAQLESEVTENSDPAARRRWWSYLFESLPDPVGEFRLLASRIRREEDLGRLEDDVLSLFRSASFGLSILDVVRLKCRYLWQIQRRFAVIVIDNVDQLPAKCLASLTRLGVQLAEGDRSPTLGLGGADSDPAVILALRPISLKKVTFGTTPLWRGIVAPPDIRVVFERRLKHFLATFEGKLLRSARLQERASGREVRLSSDSEESPTVIATSAREWIAKVSGALLQEGHYGQMLLTIQMMTNFNTRLALMVTAGFVASGHISLESIARGAEGLPVHQSARKTFAALMLGVRGVYASTGPYSSWVHNVFNDSSGDTVGCVIRLRLLKVIPGPDSEEGVSRRGLTSDLAKIFGYGKQRLVNAFNALLDLGLIEPTQGDDSYRLSQAGRCYLQDMPRDFEYLQHVAMDTYVDSRFLVECIQHDETAFVRFRRVLQMGQWLREVEVADLSSVRKRGQVDLYRRYYGTDTIAETIGACLSGVAPHLPRGGVSETNWAGLVDAARILRDESDLHHLLREASSGSST